MKETTITITITEDDLETLKGITPIDDKSGIINHIVSIVTDKFKEPPTELTTVQNVLLRGLLKLNDVPLNVFNQEYYSEIHLLEERGIVSLIDKDNQKLLHLNFDVLKYKETSLFLDDVYDELKKQFNVK